MEQILEAINSLKTKLDENLKKMDEIKNVVNETNKKFEVLSTEFKLLKNDNTEL